MSDKTQKEHYVPQRYLKHFAVNEKFFAYDKVKTEPRAGNINDYASERFFYDIDFNALMKELLEQNPQCQFDPQVEQMLKETDEQYLEHWFGDNVETWLFDPIEKIIMLYTMSNPKRLNIVQVLTDAEMDHISLYLAIQFLRSKEFRESMTELYERLPVLLMKKFAKTQEDREFADGIELKIKNKNHKKLYHAQILSDPDIAAHLAETFRNKIWMIGYHRTDMQFITSDNPVVRFGHLGSSGFNSDGIEIFFPLSTKLVLIMKDPSSFYYEAEHYNHFVELDEIDVAFINSLQVQQSYRYVFNKTDDFEMVIGMLKRNPALSDIKHKRFIMG